MLITKKRLHRLITTTCSLEALVRGYYMVLLRCISQWHQCPSLQSILSALSIPYKRGKFLVPLLTSLTSNDYTVKDSSLFVEELSSFDYAHYLTSFDIESLFTNIALEETVNICINKLFEKNFKVNNLNKNLFNLYWNWLI